MKILRYEEVWYENGKLRTGSLKVFIEDPITKKEVFWGYIPKEWVEAILRHQMTFLRNLQEQINNV